MGVNFGNKAPAKKIAGEQAAQVAQVHKPKFKALTEEQVLVDEMVQLKQKMDELEVPAMEARYDECKTKLAAFAKTADPESEKVFVGSLGEVHYSACRVETKVVDKEGLVSAMTQEVFNQVATVKLTDLKKYLSPVEYEKLIERVYGSRTCKAVVAYGADA